MTHQRVETRRSTRRGAARCALRIPPRCAASSGRRRSNTTPTRAAVRPRALGRSRAEHTADPGRVHCAPSSAASAPSLLAQQHHPRISIARQTTLLGRGRRHHQRDAVRRDPTSAGYTIRPSIAVVQNTCDGLHVGETLQTSCGLERTPSLLARRSARATFARDGASNAASVAILIDEFAFVVAHLNVHPRCASTASGSTRRAVSARRRSPRSRSPRIRSSRPCR